MRLSTSWIVPVLVLAPLPAAFADGGPQHRVQQAPPVKMGTSGGSANDRCCSESVRIPRRFDHHSSSTGNGGTEPVRSVMTTIEFGPTSGAPRLRRSDPVRSECSTE